MTTALILAFMTSALQEALAEERQRHRLVINPDYDCLPPQDFGLAGVRLGDSEETVIRRLGPPRKRSISGGEDDGGGYEINVLLYPTLTIEIVRGEVDRIVTRSPSQPTPGGIRVGDSRAALINKLGGTPRDWSSSESGLSLVSCEEAGQNREDYVVYTLSDGDRIIEIFYEASRP